MKFELSCRNVTIMLIGVLVLWLVIAWITVEVASRIKPDVLAESGLLGDTFGAANALFSGLALAGVIAAILLQHRELNLQRRDLQLQRRDLKLQTKMLELQKDELKKSAKAQEQMQDALHQQVQVAGQTARFQAITMITEAHARLLAGRANLWKDLDVTRRNIHAGKVSKEELHTEPLVGLALAFERMEAEYNSISGSPLAADLGSGQ